MSVVEDDDCLTAFDVFCAERRSGVRGVECALRRSGVPRGVTFSFWEGLARVYVLCGRERRSRSGSGRGIVWNALWRKRMEKQGRAFHGHVDTL